MTRRLARIAVGAGLATSAMAVARVATSRAYEVHGQSMAPTFASGDLVWLSRCTRARPCRPVRGDLVIALLDTVRPELAIKRVVAGPHDTVEMANARLLVNSRVVTRGRADVAVAPPAWLAARSPSILRPHPEDGAQWGPIVLGAGEVFLLGDNPPASRDSRAVGAVAMSRVVAWSALCLRAKRTRVLGLRLVQSCRAA